MTQADAFRANYKHDKYTTKVLHIRASCLAADNRVKERIAQLRAPAAEKFKITLESHLSDLLELRQLAAAAGQYSAAITAEIARGKAAGVHIEKSQVNINNLNPLVIIRHGS